MKARPATEIMDFRTNLSPVLTIKMGFSEFAARYSVILCHYWEDGLGPAHGRVFILSSGMPVYFCSMEYSPQYGSCFECAQDLPMAEVADQILNDFALSTDDILWGILDEEFGSFAVIRQDDYGNEFEVGVFGSRREAILLKDELETYQHKQSYSIEGREEPLSKKRDGSACRI